MCICVCVCVTVHEEKRKTLVKLSVKIITIFSDVNLVDNGMIILIMKIQQTNKQKYIQSIYIL